MYSGVEFDVLRSTMWIAVMIAAPILTVALVVGVVIGLLQALSSVQEMTLTFVPKFVAILVAFWITMDFMTQTLIDFFHEHIIALMIVI